MAKVDYAFKSEVLLNHTDVIALQREYSRLSYLRYYTDAELDEEYYEAVSDTVSSFFEDEQSLKIWREAEKINGAYYKRVCRLKDRLSDMLSFGECFFLTLTFTNDVLEHTSKATRRKYVIRFLKSLSIKYVANIDFGSCNGREHYHAVIMADGVDMSAWDCYGFSNAKKIRSEADCTPVGKYLAKLTNHAIKETTQGSHLIYSR